MQRVDTVQAVRDVVREWRGEGARVALVPTMGNLHAGHLRLVRAAAEHADRVVVSVFVNPLQFGPNEDFDRYPRTLEADTAALATAPCDLLFAPAVEAMYPSGVPIQTRVTVGGITEVLEGAHRPGHFDGVSTVVNLLFNQVQPDVALFGEKDYQQLAVIRRMVADLQMPVTVVGVPTERASDGLALSSRNQYLTPEERALAPALYSVLQAVSARWRAGGHTVAALEREGLERLRAAGFAPQYLALRRPDLTPLTSPQQPGVVLVAAHLGATRLIDNLQIAAVV